MSKHGGGQFTIHYAKVPEKPRWLEDRERLAGKTRGIGLRQPGRRQPGRKR